MNRRLIYSIVLSCVLSFSIGALSVYAAPSSNDKTKFPIDGQTSSGQITWPGGEVTKNTTVVLPCFTHVNSKNETIGDVSIQLAGTITVKSGYKLTIKMDPDGNWTQRAIIVVADGFSSTQGMFLVEEGASLVIEGLVDANVSGAWLGIKGSKNPGGLSDIYNETSKTWTKPTDFEQYYNTFASGYGMVTSVGNVTMKNVRLYDSYCTNNGAALVVKRNENTNKRLTYGKVSLTDCRISNCVAAFGPALVIFNQVRDGASDENTTIDTIDDDRYDPEGSAVTLTNCVIKNCYSTGENVCGTIRTGGGAYSNLKLINTTIQENYAEGTCAGVVWNAHGLSSRKTVCTFDKCTIENNYSAKGGTGLYLSSSFEFVNRTSYIRGNKSGADGGGIRIKTYSGIKGMEGYPQTMDMSLSEYAVITGNSAVNGAGIYIENPKTNDLGPNSVINFSVDGATISNNTATGNGGGVNFYGDNKTIYFNFYLNSGNITGNTAVHGGGFYGARGENLDEERVKLNFNGGEISSCQASGNGGGIYISGLHIGCAENPAKGMVLSGNKTTKNADGVGYGGGIFITSGAVFNMNSGEVSSNEAAKEGGGLYITENAVADIKGGDFDNNKSFTNGAGVFLQAGTLRMSKIGDKKSKIRNNVNGQDGKTSANGGGVYVKNGTFTIEDGEITGNVSKGYGGGIYMGNAANGDSKISITGGSIAKNEARFGAGVFVHHGECEMTGGSVDGNIASTGGGGVYVASILTVKGNSSITNNKANGDNSTDSSITNSGGGGVLVAGGGNFYMSGNSVISGNTCVTYGAGVRARYGAGEIIIDNGEISSNVADVSGGGMALFGGSITLNGGSISYNTCTRLGGGVYAAECSSFTLSDGVISSNTATGSNGGGLHFAASAKNITISGGTIEGNTAGNGGGIATDAALTLNGGVIIKENVTSGNGGGIYIGEEVLVSMEGGEISGNTSKHRGGGIAVYYGNLSIDGGKILNNVAETICGGGVHLTPNSSNTNKVTISNGLISGNSSTSGNGGGVSIIGGTCEISGGSMSDNRSIIGGGIYQSGGTLTITGGDISSNEARNGGGAFVTGSGVTMTFTDGIIRNNVAKDLSGRTLTTGYDYTVSGNALSLQGTGGGVFVQDGASLTIAGDAVGIYGNLAETMADDIYSNGKGGANVVLPDVSAMDLTGYNSKTSELYWVEDYMAGDTGYSSGTNIGGSGYTAKRYRDIITEQGAVKIVPAGTYAGKYLALSIGHEIIFVTILRSGLLKGENAIYRISRWDNNDTPADESDDKWTVFSELLLLGPEDATTENASTKSSSRRIALFSGKWKVEEIGWAWTYQHDNVIEKEITGSSSAQEKSFVFTGDKYPSTDEKYMSPQHYAESVVTNDFSAGTSVTNKAAPASSNSFETISSQNGVSW